MSIESVRRLFLYDAWANRETMQAVAVTPGLGERARNVASHLVAAEGVWLTRLRGADSAGQQIWPATDVDELFQAVAQLREGYSDALAALSDADLDVERTYRNQAGAQFTMTRGDILNHVLLHSASHRGEVLAAIGASGGDAPDTDHIVWLRAGEPAP